MHPPLTAAIAVSSTVSPSATAMNTLIPSGRAIGSQTGSHAASGVAPLPQQRQPKALL
jgi:hypothetical protein